jgi:hypothetical protein
MFSIAMHAVSGKNVQLEITDDVLRGHFRRIHAGIQLMRDQYREQFDPREPVMMAPRNNFSVGPENAVSRSMHEVDAGAAGTDVAG